MAGFGRVGHVTAQRLLALGARVTVCARSPEALAWAAALGCTTLPLSDLEDAPRAFDLVINTIPAPVFPRAVLARLDPCLILDLASAPGGVDFPAAAELGHQAIHALALPGKTAPVSAARAILATVDLMLLEFGSQEPERNVT